MGRMVKADLLDAMKNILNEYSEKRHSLKKADCSLCKLYYDIEDENICQYCPMNIFTGDSLVGCLDRKCRPVDCTATSHFYKPHKSKALEAVIEFYDLAIQKTETMTEDELNEVQAFDFLFEIDRQVAEKYELITNDN